MKALALIFDWDLQTYLWWDYVMPIIVGVVLLVGCALLLGVIKIIEKVKSIRRKRL